MPDLNSFSQYLKEYEEEHGPVPKDEVEMNENGVGGKSSSSSGTGTPKGQDSRSVSPTHETTAKSDQLKSPAKVTS